ncbi:MAG: tripartite tricarboxylate transporter permease [Eubacteriales bacterium]|nr:tripartite tricarboxylate transporter permease [Eubacteriales bacterium]
MMAYLGAALASFASLEVLIGLFVGVVGGMIIGIIPGLGPSVGIALLIPISFSMSPTAALVMMTAMYTTGVYGGSITAVLCHTPGTAASAATTMDGYELTKQGHGMEAITVVTVASVFGGLVGAICLILFAPILGRISLMFSCLEYFLVACFGLLVVSGLTGENKAKGIFSALLGLLIGCVGMDKISGVPRFTFGQLWLEDGLDSTPILIGLFSITQVLYLVDKLLKGTGNTIVDDPAAGLQGKRWTKGNTKKLAPTMLRSSVIGSFIGFIPAAGCSIAAWISYSISKRISKTPEEYGKGSVIGIAASEAANNAACGGAMIPLFTLGIPGSPVTAILYGAMLMHGLQPGSSLFKGNQAVTTYAIFLGFLFANLLMGVIGVSMAKQMAKICLVPNSLLCPIIVALACIGTFALANSMEEVVIMLAFGVLGYLMKIFGFEPAPLVLGVVLADILEANFRRALIMAAAKGGLINYFFSRPVSIIIFIIILIFAFAPAIVRMIAKKVNA